MVAFEKSRLYDQKNQLEDEVVNLKHQVEENRKQFTTKIEELTANLCEKENFILKFSHEIRNPLNSLLGNIELLQETISDVKSLDMLPLIYFSFG